MQSENKPGQKRRIGPAMQWANSRKVPRTSSDSRTYKHPKDLKNASDHEPTVPRHHFGGEVPSSDQRTASGPASDTEGSQNRTSSSLPYGPSADNVHPSSQSSAGIEAESQSAWDFYAGTVPGGSLRASHSTENSSLDPEHVSGRIPGSPHHEQYRQDRAPETYPNPDHMSVPEHTQSTDFRMRDDSESGVRRLPIAQYVLPFLVVVIIVIVGVLASL